MYVGETIGNKFLAVLNIESNWANVCCNDFEIRAMTYDIN